MANLVITAFIDPVTGELLAGEDPKGWRASHSYHEAAHAVVALRLGVPVFSVSVNRTVVESPPGWEQMRAHPHGWIPEDGHDHHVAEQIQIALAGDIVSALWFGETKEGRRDRAQVDAMLDCVEFFSDEHRAAYLDRQYQRVERLVLDNWLSIRAVAAELLKRGSVTGAMVKEIMAEHPPSQRPRTARAAAVLERNPDVRWRRTLETLLAETVKRS